MIVHHDDCVSRVGNGRSKNFAWMCDALIHAPHRNGLDTHQTVTRVEQNNTERLGPEHAHFAAKQFMDQFRRIELLLRQWFLRETLSEIECRHQFQGLGWTDSFDCPKLLDRTT